MDIRTSLHSISSGSLDSMVDCYNKTLSDTLNQHAPLINRTIKARPNTQWYNATLRSRKKELRALERRFMKSRLSVDWENFKTHRTDYHKLLKVAKRDFYSSKFDTDCPKQLYQNVNRLISPSKNILPDFTSKADLAQLFLDSFTSKVKTIKESLPPSNEAIHLDEVSTHHVLTSFTPVTEEDLKKNHS